MNIQILGQNKYQQEKNYKRSFINVLFKKVRTLTNTQSTQLENQVRTIITSFDFV